MDDLEIQQKKWLEQYPNRFLACRAGHDWPKIVPGRKLRNTRLEHWEDPDGEKQGCYYLEQRCGNCGRLRYRITGPRGQAYSGATQWQYSDPHGYATPPGLGIPKSAYMDMYFQRLIDGEDMS